MQALYRHFGHDGKLLYVGITHEPPARLRAHRRDKSWWLDVRNTTYEYFVTRSEVEDAERKAIKAEQPQWNVMHNSRGASNGVVRFQGSQQWDFKRKAFEFDHTQIADHSTSCVYRGVSLAVQRWVEKNVNEFSGVGLRAYRESLIALADAAWKYRSNGEQPRTDELSAGVLLRFLYTFTDADFSVAAVGGSVTKQHAATFIRTILEIDEARWYRDWPWHSGDFIDSRDLYDLYSVPIAVRKDGRCTYQVPHGFFKPGAFEKYVSGDPGRVVKQQARWYCHYTVGWGVPEPAVVPADLLHPEGE